MALYLGATCESGLDIVYNLVCNLSRAACGLKLWSDTLMQITIWSAAEENVVYMNIKYSVTQRIALWAYHENK